MKKSSCRQEELERLQRRYEGRGKEGKTRMLDEFCEQHGYERKHAIKLLGDQLPKAKGGDRYRTFFCRRPGWWKASGRQPVGAAA